MAFVYLQPVSYTYLVVIILIILSTRMLEKK